MSQEPKEIVVDITKIKPGKLSSGTINTMPCDRPLVSPIGDTTLGEYRTEPLFEKLKRRTSVEMLKNLGLIFLGIIFAIQSLGLLTGVICDQKIKEAKKLESVK